MANKNKLKFFGHKLIFKDNIQTERFTFKSNTGSLLCTETVDYFLNSKS